MSEALERIIKHLDYPLDNDPDEAEAEKFLRNLETDHAQLVALVKALPLVRANMHVVHDEWEHTHKVVGRHETGHVLYGFFESQEEAEAYKALLEARRGME